jgi:hypothetical protein
VRSFIAKFQKKRHDKKEPCPINKKRCLCSGPPTPPNKNVPPRPTRRSLADGMPRDSRPAGMRLFGVTIAPAPEADPPVRDPSPNPPVAAREDVMRKCKSMGNLAALGAVADGGGGGADGGGAGDGYLSDGGLMQSSGKRRRAQERKKGAVFCSSCCVRNLCF